MVRKRILVAGVPCILSASIPIRRIPDPLNPSPPGYIDFYYGVSIVQGSRAVSPLPLVELVSTVLASKSQALPVCSGSAGREVCSLAVPRTVHKQRLHTFS